MSKDRSILAVTDVSVKIDLIIIQIILVLHTGLLAVLVFF